MNSSPSMNQSNNLYLMFGLPGSGKTRWIKENNLGCIVVSPDEIKEVLIETAMTEDITETVHEKSVRLSRDHLYKLMEDNTNSVIFDAGGINNNFTSEIIDKAKELKYNITLIHMDTPLDICIARNLRRSRKFIIPEKNIRQKSERRTDILNSHLTKVDKYLKVRQTIPEYVFFDMDGCVAAIMDLPKDEHGNVMFTTNEYFRKSLPVPVVINKLKTLHDKGITLIPLSASPSSITSQHKTDWLEKHMPFVDKAPLFVGNKDFKIVMLYDFINFIHVLPEEVILIDDNMKTIDAGKQYNIKVIHPSYFLTKEFFNGNLYSVQSGNA